MNRHLLIMFQSCVIVLYFETVVNGENFAVTLTGQRQMSVSSTTICSSFKLIDPLFCKPHKQEVYILVEKDTVCLIKISIKCVCSKLVSVLSV